MSCYATRKEKKKYVTLKLFNLLTSYLPISLLRNKPFSKGKKGRKGRQKASHQRLYNYFLSSRKAPSRRGLSKTVDF